MTANDRSLLLVHGVGHHRPGAIAALVAAALAEAGVPSLTPSELNWDGLHRLNRRSPRTLDIADLTTLGHAFWAASWLGIDDTVMSPRMLRVLRAVSSALSTVVGLWVLALFWWLLAWGAAHVTASVPALRVGLPWTSYLFPPVPPDLLARTGAWAQLALTFLSAGGVLLTAALAFLTWTMGRVRLASALRSAAFRMLWFPTYLLGVLPTTLAYLAAVAFGVGFLSTAGALKFTIELPDKTTWAVGPGWVELATAAGVALGLGGLAVAAGWLLWRALKPIVDVVRYVGDGELREHVHGLLLEKVSEFPPRSNLVIAAHSLGTVIAVDALLSRPDVWSKFRRIDLVTAGSPLHRLLARFFSSAYPPVAHVATVLHRVYPGFRWLNLYRPTDYVGGRLPADLIANRRLWRSAWRTHSNYWADHQAVAWLVQQLKTAGESSRDAHDQGAAPSKALDVEQRLRPPRLDQSAVGWMVLPVGVLGCLGIVWSQFVWTPQVERTNLAEWQRLVSTTGTSVVVDAVEARAIDTATDQVGQDYEVVAFSYRAVDRVYGAESDVASLFYASSRFPHVDWQRLSADVKASPARRVPIEVVYATDNPRVFVVPAYSARPSFYGVGRIALYLLRTSILGGCWLVWCAALRTVLANLAPTQAWAGARYDVRS